MYFIIVTTTVMIATITIVVVTMTICVSILIVSLQHFPIGFLGDGISVSALLLWQDHLNSLITNFTFAMSLITVISIFWHIARTQVHCGRSRLCSVVFHFEEDKKNTHSHTLVHVHKRLWVKPISCLKTIFILDAPEAPSHEPLVSSALRACCCTPSSHGWRQAVFLSRGENLFVKRLRNLLTVLFFYVTVH